MPSTQISGNTILGIAEGLDLVLISADEVLVQFGTRSRPSELLRDPDLTGLLGQLIGPLLLGPKAFDELLSNCGSNASTATAQIADLLERGIITDVASSPVDQYLRYTFTGDSSLATRSVGIIGAGPVGSRIAHGLLQHGVGRICLLDDRRINPLWHAFASPFFATRVHHEAAEYAHRALRDQLIATGYERVEALDAKLDLEGLQSAVLASDLVILALEHSNIRLGHLLNRVCIQNHRPWILALIDGNLGLIGPLFVPTSTACFNCYRVLAEAATPSKDMARKYQRTMLSRNVDSFFPGLPAYVDMVSSHASLAVVHFFLRQSCFALGRVLIYDFERMLVDVEDVLKLPRCPVCSTDRSAHQPVFPLDIVDQVIRENPTSTGAPRGNVKS